ncbi:variable surface lipoprotein [Mycoplasmopsis agalactiae]|nr:variable surface lipoprotein [Mycoplasmopsis agalactiae]MCE6090545.1 variable surface lipoprotein [Mycoplasmopsis agalactiae]
MNRRNKHIMFFGSLITLGSIPFIAAKCNDGSTKEESKNNETRPTDSSSDQNKNKNDDANGQDQPKNDKDNLVNNNNNSSTNSNSETINHNSNPTPPYHKKVKESHEEAASRLTKEYFDLLLSQKETNMSESMSSDEPEKSEADISDESNKNEEHKEAKEKLKLMFQAFDKYKEAIENHLKDKNSITSLNNDLDKVYQAIRYDAEKIKSFLVTLGLDANSTMEFLYDFFDFMDLLSSLVTNNMPKEGDKQKAFELFKKIKSKIDEAYKKAFNK